MSVESEKLLSIAEEKAKELVLLAAKTDDKNHQEKLDIIVKTINQTVNGKIDGLRKEFKDYIIEDMKWKEEDRKWKKEATPVVDLYKGTTFFGSWIRKGFVAIAKFIILVGATFGGWTVIKNFFEK